MYKFTDLNQAATQALLPSVAMVFNGKIFEEELKGYRTLNVYGRETLSREVDSEARSKSNGSMFYGVRLPSRVITVEYKLSADSASEMQAKFNRLRRLQYSIGEVPFSFLDEPEYTYFGVVSGADEPDPSKLSVVSKFSIFCSNPDKFGELVKTSGAVTVDTFYPTQPEKMTVTLSATVNKLSVTNGRETISLTGTFNAGSKVAIDVKEQTVLLNGVNRPDVIDLNSDFENFFIKNGDTVTSSSGSLELQMKEVMQ